MRIFVNRKIAKGPWGGENSFMGALCRWLSEKGHTVTTDRSTPVDIALLNALTLIDLDTVRYFAERGVPIVHRKTGFTCRGSDELRATKEGVVEGDRRQIEFTPYLGASIFQSRYSFDLFSRQGFNGPGIVIPNGVDETRFNHVERHWGGLRRRQRRYWARPDRLRFLTVSWSTDASKGFADLQAIDREIAGRDDLTHTFVGRLPNTVSFEHIRYRRPQGHQRLANTYRQHDVLIFLGRHETCSNTILEGINCGLPIIYHPSGGNPESAAPYGLPYMDSLTALLDEVRERHGEWVEATADNPFRISVVGPRYLEVLEAVLAGETVSVEPAATQDQSPVEHARTPGR